MLPVVVVAQVYPSLVELPYYDCIKYDANVLHICGDSAKFSSFFSKLDSLALWGNNRINVVHIGGSHIQAGVFSNRMRMNFARLLPGFSAERGAIFP